VLRSIATIGFVVLATLSVVAPADATGEDPSPRPNVVLILTDDMRADDLAYMPHTRRLIASRGTEFADAVSPHPLCCPARAELFTGQYAQNSGLRHNDGPYGGMAAFTGWENTLPVWLKKAGYRTGYTGKLFNGYRGGALPGWDRFDPFTAGVYRPYGFKTWNDGAPRTVPGVHTTDYTNRETVRMINRFSGKHPFFIWAGHSAPHKRKEAGVRAPDRYLSSHLETQPTFGTAEDTLNLDLFRERLQALQAVDEAVRDAVRALRATGELESTLIVFTSDNGFLLGEGGLYAKNQPQEGSLRIPLLLRGPGVPVGQSDALSSLLDIPATIIEATGALPGRLFDGANLLGQRVAERDALLIQAGSTVADWEWRGVRTRTHTYVAYHGTGTEVLWDRVADPNERTDLAPEGPPELHALRERLAWLGDCAGEACG
jgi:arylsulfatase A-like enzyme